MAIDGSIATTFFVAPPPCRFIGQLHSRDLATKLSKGKTLLASLGAILMAGSRSSRRAFVRSAAAGACAVALSAKSYGRVLGSAERVRLGLIGFGLIGRTHVQSFQGQPDARIVAVSDAYAPRMDACQEMVGETIGRHRDFRKLLDDRQIDAAIVATPDHWHAMQTMLACHAGKDVYVEKPLTLFVREGEWMQRVAERTKRVVQVGAQQRSGPHYARAKSLLASGAIGEIASAECTFVRNVSPGFGSPPDSPPPPELDYELWLGPAPKRAYNPNRSIYHFRWFWDYSGGQMTNLGHHSLDIVHWFFDLPAPGKVASFGGRRFLKDNCETPDVQDAVLDYGKLQVAVRIRECAAGKAGASGGLTFTGTRGTLTIGRDGFEIVPDKRIDPRNAVASVNGGRHPVGGPRPVEEPRDDFWCEPLTDATGSSRQQYELHARNFLDCVKSRNTPVTDLASSHRVSTSCHLANISLRLGRQVAWDEAAQLIGGDVQAAAMLVRPYRAPWDAELRAMTAEGVRVKG